MCTVSIVVEVAWVRTIGSGSLWKNYQWHKSLWPGMTNKNPSSCVTFDVEPLLLMLVVYLWMYLIDFIHICAMWLRNSGQSGCFWVQRTQVWIQPLAFVYPWRSTYSRRRWTTVSAQTSNMYGILPCSAAVFLPIGPSSYSNKELHGILYWL